MNRIEIDQLCGKIYVDYSIIMIRAQPGKLASLSYLVFGLKQNWNSIFGEIKALSQRIDELEKLHPACKFYFRIFLDVATERLKTDGWLRN
jgi:hypothetical protein